MTVTGTGRGMENIACPACWIIEGRRPFAYEPKHSCSPQLSGLGKALTHKKWWKYVSFQDGNMSRHEPVPYLKKKRMEEAHVFFFTSLFTFTPRVSLLIAPEKDSRVWTQSRQRRVKVRNIPAQHPIARLLRISTTSLNMILTSSSPESLPLCCRITTRHPPFHKSRGLSD